MGIKKFRNFTLISKWDKLWPKIPLEKIISPYKSGFCNFFSFLGPKKIISGQEGIIINNNVSSTLVLELIRLPIQIYSIEIEYLKNPKIYSPIV
jgi:hypothetical protein